MYPSTDTDMYSRNGVLLMLNPLLLVNRPVVQRNSLSTDTLTIRVSWRCVKVQRLRCHRCRVTSIVALDAENPPHSPPLVTPQGAGWLPHGFHMESHSHPDGQLVYAAAGAFATTTEYGTWVAPANRVTWTPPGFQHSHRFYGRTDARILAVPSDECGALVGYPCVFAVSPLLREGIL